MQLMPMNCTLIFFLKIRSCILEREHAESGETEGEGKTEPQAESPPKAEPISGLDLMTQSVRPELKSRASTQLTEPPA